MNNNFELGKQENLQQNVSIIPIELHSAANEKKSFMFVQSLLLLIFTEVDVVHINEQKQHLVDNLYRR